MPEKILGSYLESILSNPSTCRDPSTKTSEIMVVSSIVIALILLFSMSRWAVRLSDHWDQKKNGLLKNNRVSSTWLGEALNVFGVVCAVASLVLYMVASQYGIGRHLCDLGLNEALTNFIRHTIQESRASDPDMDLMTWIKVNQNMLDPVLTASLEQFLKSFRTSMIWLYSCNVCYTLALTLQKYSNDCFILFLFGWNEPLLQRFIRCHRFTVAGVLTLTLFLTFLGIWPVGASLDIAVNRKWLWSPRVIYQLTAALNILLDLSVAVVPLWYLHKQLKPWGEKILLCCLFGFQGVAIGVGTTRIFFLGGLFGADLTYNAVAPLNLTMIQLMLFIVAFCFPSLSKVFRYVRAIPSRLCGTNPPIPLERFRTEYVPRSMRVSGGSQWSHWDDCFTDDIPGNLTEAKSPFGSEFEIAPSVNGLAMSVSSRV